MSIRLVVNADDLGLTDGVNRATMRAYRAGLVTSTSLLAVGRAFEHAVAQLSLHPGLDVGAHLAIVGEDPPLLSAREVPTLVDRAGRFPLSYRTVVARAAAGRLDPDDVRRELTTQLDRIRGAGLTVTHLDTHQHTHLWPLVGRVVAGLASDEQVPWVRLPNSRARGPVGALVRRLSARLGRQLTALGVRAPAAYAGLDEAGRMDAARFARAVASVSATAGRTSVQTAEINVHPGEAGDADLERFGWHYLWEDELTMLTDPASRRLLDRHGLRLASFRDLTEAGR